MNADAKLMLERVKVADETLRIIAALRIALDTLVAYASEDNGQEARDAVKRIEAQLDPEATPSPLALDNQGGS